MSEPIKDILVDAKNYINLNGWYQGGFFPEDQAYDFQQAAEKRLPVCAWGAIIVTAGFSDNVDECLELADLKFDAMKAVESAVGDVSIANWNDNPDRTKQDVLNAFDRAVESLDE